MEIALASGSRRRTFARVLPAALLLLAAIAPRARAGESTAESSVATHPEILADDVKTRVRFLASEALEGRASTEPGGFAASAYVAAEFQRLGLKPLGDDGGWYQGFPIAIPKLGEGNALEATVKDAKKTFAVEKAWNPFAISPKAEASGALAFAGYGISAPEKSYDDFAGFDAKGKVLLVLRKEPPWGKSPSRHATFLAKLGQASKHGAAALLVVNDPRTTKSSPDALFPWASSLGPAPGSGSIPFAFVTQETALALLSPSGKDLVALQEACDAAAAAGKAAPPAFDVTSVVVRARTEVTSATGKNARNVVGLLEGGDATLKDEVVVVGAHHDHVGRGLFGSAGGAAAVGKIHYGADDNASGTAAILEVAEAMAAETQRPKRSVLFLSFSGEEMGLLGSAYYAAHPVLPLAKTSVMVNCDMLGRYREDVGLEVGGVGTGKGLEDLVKAANAGRDVKLTWNPNGDLPSDNISFFEKKVPVVSFFTGLHDAYHTPRDTWETLDYPGEEKVTRLCYDVVLRLANAAERVAYTDPPHKARAVLGIQPADADAEGVAVGALTEDGPAKKAGMEVGDVVVGFGTQTIRKPGDLFQALSSKAPGDVVEVRVLRGTEAKTLTVTLGSR